MKVLEKILEEIRAKAIELKNNHWGDDERHLTGKGVEVMCIQAEQIIRKHMNDGWIPVEERLPEKEYTTVLCVTDKNYYFVGVYNRKKRFRTGDIYAEGKVIAWMPLEPYRPERSEK